MSQPRKTSASAEGRHELSDSLTAEVASRLSMLDRADWEHSVPQENFFLQWEYLETFERVAPPNLRFYYVQLYERSKPVAVLYFQLIHLSAEEIGYILKPLSGEVLLPSIIGQWSEWLQRTKEDKGFRMLISGNNFISGEYGVGMTKGASPARIFTALADIVKLITGNDRSPGKISAILVKDYFAPAAQADHLRKKRYHRFLVEPEMIVSLDKSWRTPDDYAAAMSKKYRNRLRSVYKKSSVLTTEEMDAHQVRQHAAELYQLYYNVHERAKFRLAALGEDYFPGMKESFPDRFSVTAYRLDGKLVAFRSSFRTNNHLEAHFIGIDYRYNPEHCLYQRILYDYVAEGIRSGVTAVYLGRTAAEMKSTVGAVAHDLVCYIRHRNGLSNQVIRPFIDYLKPSDWTPRNPFRESSDLPSDSCSR